MEIQEYFIQQPVLRIEFSDGNYCVNATRIHTFSDCYDVLTTFDLNLYNTFQFVSINLYSDYEAHLDFLESVINVITSHRDGDREGIAKSVYIDLSCWENAKGVHLVRFCEIVQQLVKKSPTLEEFYVNLEFWRSVNASGYESFFTIMAEVFSIHSLRSLHINTYKWEVAESRTLEKLSHFMRTISSESLQNLYISISYWDSIVRADFSTFCASLGFLLNRVKMLRSLILNFAGLRNCADYEIQSLCNAIEVVKNQNSVLVVDFDLSKWAITDQAVKQVSDSLVRILQGQPIWSLRLSLSYCGDLSNRWGKGILKLFAFILSKKSLAYPYMEFEGLDSESQESVLVSKYLHALTRRSHCFEQIATLTLPAIQGLRKHFRREIIDYMVIKFLSGNTDVFAAGNTNNQILRL